MNERQLIQEVGTWSLNNFGETGGKDYGIAEEIGEAIHCVLKRNQSIRGFDNDKIFKENFTDALGDAIIYLADWCYSRNVYFQFKQTHRVIERANERLVICQLLQTTSAMFSHSDIIYGDEVDESLQAPFLLLAQRLCTGLEYWAEIYDLNLALIVSATWGEVQKRDWKSKPKTGK